MKYVNKQFNFKFRDVVNSFIVGVLTPTIYSIVEFFDSGVFDFTKESFIKVAVIGVTAFVANLLRKLVEPTRVIEVKPLALPPLGDDGGDKTLPPPLGDPTNPIKK